MVNILLVFLYSSKPQGADPPPPQGATEAGKITKEKGIYGTDMDTDSHTELG